MRRMNRLGGKKENLVYLLLWVVVFIVPVFSMAVRSRQDGGTAFDWPEIFSVWKIYAVFLVIFLFHNFVLAPLLVYRRRSWLYFTSTVCLVFVLMLWRCVARPPMPHDGRPPHVAFGQSHGHGPVHGPGRPIHEMPPGSEPERPPRPTGRKDGIHPPVVFGQEEVMGGLFAVLLLGMNLGVKLYFKSEEDRKAYAELKHSSLEQQLEYLRYQINPHFLMNTLNNIHALVDIDPERSKKSIVELSKLMRYVLYEGAKDEVPLSRELDFVQNYITLMRLRYTDKVRIAVNLPESLPDWRIPPMLFISFVENAFKHGVSYSKESFIEVSLHCAANHLTFICRNSKHDSAGGEQGGVGLENVRRRLALIYGDSYRLDIEDGEQTYGVTLSIPLTDNAYEEK